MPSTVRRIIDQFKLQTAKRNPIQEIQILIDPVTGAISTIALAGNPNNPLNTYYLNTRTYPTGTVITSFCDYTTHTQTVVTATNTFPYASVTINTNSASCYYNEPIPKPADPPNPFGTLIYRPYKYTEFCDFFGNNVRVDILRKYNYEQPQTIIQVDSFVKDSITPIQVKVFVDRIKQLVSYTGSAQNDSNSTRTFAPDDLITEICDFDTGTNLKVYAQANAPFAYIVTEPDASQCQIPTVEPTYIENWGSPVIMDYKTEGDNKNPQFAPCEVTLNLLSGPNFSLQDLYTEDEREFQVVISRDFEEEPEVIFKGYLIPDACQEPFVRAPYEVSIKATDGIGTLKTISYTMPIVSDTKVLQRFIDVLAYALAPTNLSLNIRTICNIYEQDMHNGIDDDPLSQSYISPLRFSGSNGQPMTCYQVLEEVCKAFKACLCQENGEWVFKRRSEYTQNKARSRVYNDKALFLYSEQIDAIRTLGNFDNSDIKIFDPQPDLYRGNAYKRVEVLGKYGDVPSIIFNGGFDLWDGQNFPFWTKYGSINIERDQKFIASKGYQSFPVEDWALSFNERANENKWIEATTILVLKEDKLTLKFNLFSALNYGIKFRVRLGAYYLTNIFGSNTFEWVNQVATCVLMGNLGMSPLPTNGKPLQVSMPECPVDGELRIQFFGPQHYILGFSGAGGIHTYSETNEFQPMGIDKVSISKETASDVKSPDGFLTVSEQSGFYTKKPDMIEILFSDYSYQRGGILFIEDLPIELIGRDRSNTDPSVVVDDLYAILLSDNSYSQLWYEYGTSSGRVPFATLLAKSILKDYQKPYWYASGNYLGQHLRYSNSLRFDLECEPDFSLKVFTLLSCTIDIKSCTMTGVNMAELFDKFVKSTEISLPYYPGDSVPGYINNPNSPPQIPAQGIFTDEFTNEFL